MFAWVPKPYVCKDLRLNEYGVNNGNPKKKRDVELKNYDSENPKRSALSSELPLS